MYNIGDRIRFDESLREEDDYPYVGVGRIISKATSNLWEIEVEWVKDPSGEEIGSRGDSYVVFENEIAEVLND